MYFFAMLLDYLLNVAKILEYVAPSIHIFATLSFFRNIIKKKNCTGISGKTQILYCLVSAARYLIEIISIWQSFRNDLISVVPYLVIYLYVILPFVTLLPIYFFYNSSYQSHYDKFKLWYLIIPSILLNWFSKDFFNIIDFLMKLSNYLEAVAVIPQMYLCSKTKKIENIIYNYIVLMAIYKSCQLIATFIKYINTYYPYNYAHLIFAGVVQLMFYFDFLISNKVKYDEVGVGASNEVQSVFIIHPKEVEAMRSSAESEARIAEERRMFDTNEIIHTHSQLPVGL